MKRFNGEEFISLEEERLYSTGSNELDEVLERAFCEGYEYAQREFNAVATKIANASKGLKSQGFLFPEGAAKRVITGSKGPNWRLNNAANADTIVGLKQARAAKKGQTLSRWSAYDSLKGIV